MDVKRLSIILCMIFAILSAKSQTSMSLEEVKELRLKLLNMIDLMSKESDGAKRLSMNREFDKRFGQLLSASEIPGMNKDSLPLISTLTSPDASFSIHTWEVEGPEGDMHYFGYVKSKKGEQKAIVFHLQDSSATMDRPEYIQARAHRWYGALYYDMRQVRHKKETYYILLGINRSRRLTKERIVETAWVDDQVYFGKEVFDEGKAAMKKRLIYPHNTDTDMTLVFEDDETIVLDHLSPESPAFEGKFEYYVPDMSYDAWLLKKGNWVYKADHDARLAPNLKDRYYEMDLPEQKKVY